MDPAGREAMLDLLLCLGRDHDKCILLSTHLLGDIDRVCDRVVILDRGRVLCQGAVEDLCRRRQDRYRLQIQGDSQNYLEELRLEGASILGDNGRGEVRVAVPAGWVTRAFFLLADHHGVLVRGLEIDDEDLEELFHRVIEENQAGPR
jgi:ABC-2 type transport system ATP-binding protein